MVVYKPVKKVRTEEEISKRADEASKGIVITKAPGMSDAELAGAKTVEEKEITERIIKELEV